MRKITSNYFGSVRFFKNLILLVVVILITVPTILAIRFGLGLRAQKKETQRLRSELEERDQSSPEPGAWSYTTTPAAPEGASAPDPAEPVYYQSLYPDFYAPTGYHATQRTENTIYLTFDDGPSTNTDRILEILAEKDVKATFFVTGCSDEASFRRMRAIVNQGHTLGMHTYTHNYTAIYTSVEAYLDDMYQIFTQIRETTGVTPTVFRFPGGSINAYNGGIYQELIAEMMRRGFVPYDWNLSAEDATGTQVDVDDILQSVVGNTRRRGIERGFVLMHDSSRANATVNALGSMIDQLRDMGYEFDRITPETKPVLFGYRDHE